MDKLTGKVFSRNGSLACGEVPMTIQGESFVLEMHEDTASFIWDGQQQEYKIQTNSKQIGNFTAICTHFIRMPKNMARCFFVKSEFLPQS